MRVLQCPHMGCYALYEGRYGAQSDVVPSFEDTHDSAMAELVGNSLKVLSEPLIVKLIDRCVFLTVDVVVLVGIETR